MAVRPWRRLIAVGVAAAAENEAFFKSRKSAVLEGRVSLEGELSADQLALLEGRVSLRCGQLLDAGCVENQAIGDVGSGEFVFPFSWRVVMLGTQQSYTDLPFPVCYCTRYTERSQLTCARTLYYSTP